MKKKALKLSSLISFSLLLTSLNCNYVFAEETAIDTSSYDENQLVSTQSFDRDDAINLGDNYEWEGVVDDDGTVTITGRNYVDWAEDGVLEIPETVSGYTVDAISGYGLYPAFSIFSPEVITTLKLPSTVKTIDPWTFSTFSNLTTVYLPNGNEFLSMDVHNDPFEGCTKIETLYATDDYSLSSSTLQKSVKTINFYEGVTDAYGVGFEVLTTINLPSSIQNFGWYDSPQLTTLNCSKLIEQIGITATAGCTNLRIPVNVPAGTTVWDSFYNSGITSFTADLSDAVVNKNSFRNCPNIEYFNVTGRDYHSEDGLLWEGNNLIAYPAGKSWSGNYDVPENTETIYTYAFDSCKFTSITIPENVNPNFRWDRADSFYPDRVSCVDKTNITKVRIVSGSAATDWYPTKEELSEVLGIPSSQIEFYTGNTYKISYNLDGGTNASGNPTSYVAGADPITLKNPTKKGYVFLGWKRNDISGGYENTTARADDGYFQDYTFTACWSADLPYNDVNKNEWFQNSVEYVYNNGLMTGLNETTFGPYENLARAQFAVILHRMNDEPSIEYTNKFPDVANEQWYTDAILWASDIGVVTGYSDTGNFGPGDNINREQMAVMMYRYANYLGYDTSASANFSKFKDAKNVNEFAKEAMSWAVGAGIITGKDNETRLDPQGNASRAECATIIMRFMEYYK